MYDNKLDWKNISNQVIQHLKALIQIDSSNPPGKEYLVAEYVATELSRIGIEPHILSHAHTRDNVIGRLKGNGKEKPFLLSSPLTVAPAPSPDWKYSPFSGAEAEECIWGRGCLNIKCGTAYHLALLETLKENEIPLNRDIILAIVADGEKRKKTGSRFLINEHPEKVKAEYSFGEYGGFSTYLAKKHIIPLQVAQKGSCQLKATATGSGGHSTFHQPHSAIIKLAHGIEQIGQERLPLHITEPTKDYLKQLAVVFPYLGKTLLGLLTNTHTAAAIVPQLLRNPTMNHLILPMLLNTASPTMLKAGKEVNITPETAEAFIDGRTLPGHGPGDLVRELKTIAPELDFKVIHASSSIRARYDTKAFNAISEVINNHIPDCHVIPLMFPYCTDAKNWAQLGTECYGFVPLPLPEDFPHIFDLIHGPNERVPIKSLEKGSRIFTEVMLKICSPDG